MRHHALLYSMLLVCLAQCMGPRESRLEQLTKDYEAAARIESTPEDTWRTILKDTLPLLQKKDYVDRRDKKKISELVFRSSILAAAAAHRLGKPEAARSLYMNAYLENEPLALKALRDRLPAKSDVTLFEKVHIPAYTVARTTETAPGHLEITVEAQLENPEFYLLQMICGDLLRKQQAARSDLKAMKVWIVNNSAPAADGRWDEEGDEIHVHLFNSLDPG